MDREVEELFVRIRKLEVDYSALEEANKAIKAISRRLAQDAAVICIIRRAPSGRPVMVHVPVHANQLDHERPETFGPWLIRKLRESYAAFLAQTGEA